MPIIPILCYRCGFPLVGLSASDNVGLCTVCADPEGIVRFPENHDPSHIERLTKKLRSLDLSIHEADRGGTKSYILSIYPSEIDFSESIRRVLDKHGFKTLYVSTMGGMSILIKWDRLDNSSSLDIGDL